jgi:hypothetical protein
MKMVVKMNEEWYQKYLIEDVIFTDGHYCVKYSEIGKIDILSGKGYDRCYGKEKMILGLWFQDKGGLEDNWDGWVQRRVKFCPFCGLKSEDSKMQEDKIFLPKGAVFTVTDLHEG